jgi:hypothetical protein
MVEPVSEGAYYLAAGSEQDGLLLFQAGGVEAAGLFAHVGRARTLFSRLREAVGWWIAGPSRPLCR